MAIARPLLATLALLITAGGIVLQFFVILSGVGGDPVNLVYFLETTTDGIAGVVGARATGRNPARWTYLAICSADGSRNTDCSSTGAAIPFDMPVNFGTTIGVPEPFINTSYYFYMSRVAWAFYLIALFFAVVTFFISLLAICARLGAYATGFFGLVTFVFQVIAAALMTAWTVRARNVLNDNGQEASLGQYAYGFTWGAVGCFLIASILVCVGGSAGKSSNKQKNSYFGRKSERSRGSFIDSADERHGVKEDYDDVPPPTGVTSYARGPA